jgi:hypothetical protein
MPKYAVQINKDGEHHKAELFDTFEEAIEFCHELIKQGDLDFSVYELRLMNVIII